MLAVLLSSPSQSLPNSEDYDGEDNYTARERRETREHRDTEEEEERRRRRKIQRRRIRRIQRRRKERRDWSKELQEEGVGVGRVGLEL